MEGHRAQDKSIRGHFPWMASIGEMANYDYKGPANVESACKAIDYDMKTAVVTDFSDCVAFKSVPEIEDAKHLQELTELIELGNTYISLFYTYRSVSKAVPQNAEDPNDLMRIHETSFAVLHSEIEKLAQLMRFYKNALAVVNKHFRAVILVEAKKGIHWQAYLDLIVDAINMLALMDALKDNKSCLINDFACYKRAFGRCRQNLADADAHDATIRSLQMFIGNPSYPRDLIMHELKLALQLNEDYDLGILALLEHTREAISTRRFLLPSHEFGYLRVTPFLLFLLDGRVKLDDYGELMPDPIRPGAKDINAFRHKTLDLAFFKKLYRATPFVPLYGDMHIDVLFVLRRCGHWDEDSMRSEWAPVGAAAVERVSQGYLLLFHHAAIRAEYAEFTTEFAALLIEIRAVNAANAPVTPELLDRMIATVLKGLRYTAQWTARVHLQCAWKYANPCPREAYLVAKGLVPPVGSLVAPDPTKDGAAAASGSAASKRTLDAAGVAKLAAAVPRTPGEEYEQALRFNHSAEELHVLVDVIGMIKGTGSLMLDNEIAVMPFINRAVHDMVQIFVQTEVARPLRKAYKNSRADVSTLFFAMREVAGDWHDYLSQRNDFQLVKKDLVQVSREFPHRPTAPTMSQLMLLRRMVHTVFSPRAPGMKGGFFSDKNIKDEWLPVWTKFHHDSYFFPSLLDYGNSIKAVTDMSFLWFREFYLEMTGCVQFPIAMSLPWVLADYVISNPAQKDNLFYPFDIYNDAAASALYTLKQRFLYDEVEAELNLAFDQLVYHLSNDIYDYHRTLAAGVLVNKRFKAAFEAARASGAAGAAGAGTGALSVRHARYEALMHQTHVTLLGRSVDVTHLLTLQCTALLRSGIDLAIARFEAQELSSVVEFAALLRQLRLTHALLAHRLPQLQPFEALYRDVNGTAALADFRGRVLLHAYSELRGDIFPLGTYNAITQRWVKLAPGPATAFLDAVVEPMARDAGPQLEADKRALYGGKGHRDALERHMQLYAGFFGAEHVAALAEVLSPGETAQLAQAVTDHVRECVLASLLRPLVTMAARMRQVPIKPVSSSLGVVAAVESLTLQLAPYAAWPALRSHIFHRLRELGNALSFLTLLDDAVAVRAAELGFQTAAWAVAAVPRSDLGQPPRAGAAVPPEATQPRQREYLLAATDAARPGWGLAFQAAANDVLKSLSSDAPFTAADGTFTAAPVLSGATAAALGAGVTTAAESIALQQLRYTYGVPMTEAQQAVAAGKTHAVPAARQSYLAHALAIVAKALIDTEGSAAAGSPEAAETLAATFSATAHERARLRAARERAAEDAASHGAGGDGKAPAPVLPLAVNLQLGQSLVRVLASVLFLYNAAPARGNMAERTAFGDGVLTAAAALVHVHGGPLTPSPAAQAAVGATGFLMPRAVAAGRRHGFELADLSTQVVRVDMVAPLSRDLLDARAAAQPANAPVHAAQQRASYFLANAASSRVLLAAAFDTLETHCADEYDAGGDFDGLAAATYTHFDAAAPLETDWNAFREAYRYDEDFAAGVCAADVCAATAAASGVVYRGVTLKSPINASSAASEASASASYGAPQSSSAFATQAFSTQTPAAPQAPHAPMAPPAPLAPMAPPAPPAPAAPQAPQAPTAPQHGYDGGYGGGDAYCEQPQQAQQQPEYYDQQQQQQYEQHYEQQPEQQQQQQYDDYNGGYAAAPVAPSAPPAPMAPMAPPMAPLAPSAPPAPQAPMAPPAPPQFGTLPPPPPTQQPRRPSLVAQPEHMPTAPPPPPRH